MKNKDIPQPIKNVLDNAAQTYADSKSTTNAGRVLRWIARLLPPSIVIKIFSEQNSKK